MANIPTINYKEIFDAWKISLNPTLKQEELAKLRLDVCLGCKYRKECGAARSHRSRRRE